jgi:hypothetical protein
MELGSSFLFLQEQIKDIIIIRPSSVSFGHRAFIDAKTPPGPQCTSQAPHRL